ncbi:hypothetical protein [Cellulomonas cellasea]|uniref:Uncharacterized membrane protein YdcZ (DUF606 family) n=1 Tax=Cellulomonas cellasea TaxID=43670 RepID=A0A7W4YCZ8_9CELL|nr:hypothetical protein [Cellulomonas cellasea]MBB2924684.1 uncharacterized membrane protein YdcZ (DUF606 family) [Cellulomonas cellasea]
MAAHETAVPEWRLNRESETLRERAKRAILVWGLVVGVGAGAAVASYASALQTLGTALSMTAVLAGGFMLLRGVRDWATADRRAEERLTRAG